MTMTTQLDRPNTLSRWMLLLFGVMLSSFLMLSACGGDDNSNSNSNQTCKTDHSCSGGSCECKTSGKEGTACADNDDMTAAASDKCEAKCKVCS